MTLKGGGGTRPGHDNCTAGPSGKVRPCGKHERRKRLHATKIARCPLPHGQTTESPRELKRYDMAVETDKKKKSKIGGKAQAQVGALILPLKGIEASVRGLVLEKESGA